METIQKIFTYLLFSEILKGISNTLQYLTSVQLSVDEIVGESRYPPPPSVIKRESEIAWYKV